MKSQFATSKTKTTFFMAKAKNAVKPVLPDEVIMSKIYVIRGQKVMLDRDLAELYEVETKRLNE